MLKYQISNIKLGIIWALVCAIIFWLVGLISVLEGVGAGKNVFYAFGAMMLIVPRLTITLFLGWALIFWSRYELMIIAPNQPRISKVSMVVIPIALSIASIGFLSALASPGEWGLWCLFPSVCALSGGFISAYLAGVRVGGKLLE